MTNFDVFGDAATAGYLRNTARSNNLDDVRALENDSFEGNLAAAVQYLGEQPIIRYKQLLDTHKILFGDVYPWAGQDRSQNAPGLEISRGGYRGMFADPTDIERVARAALHAGNQPELIRAHPGEVFERLAHAHPFLEGNGRTITTIHTELCVRAGISIDWNAIGKPLITRALTADLTDPGEHHLDRVVQQHIRKHQTGLNVQRLVEQIDGLNPSLKQPAINSHPTPEPPARKLR